MPLSNLQSVLITGANGLMGRALAQSLSAEGVRVHGLVRALPTNPLPGITYHCIDLGAPWQKQDLPRGMDTVVHLAQSSRFREFPAQAMDLFHVNIDSTARLLDYAHATGVRTFAYASSGGVYGSGFPVSEDAPIPPHGQLGYYIGSKLCSEILVQNYATELCVHIMRFFFTYGAEQKRSMLLPRLVDNVRAGNPIQLQGEQGISINPLHVSDAVRGIEQILSLPESSVHNLAGSETVSIRAIAELAGRLLGKVPKFEHQPGHGKDLVADIDALKQRGWQPQVHLAEGIAELL